MYKIRVSQAKELISKLSSSESKRIGRAKRQRLKPSRLTARKYLALPTFSISTASLTGNLDELQSPTKRWTMRFNISVPTAIFTF